MVTASSAVTVVNSKPRFPRAAAITVTRELVALMRDRNQRLIVAGSLRRGKKDVGDIELLYIPMLVAGPRLDLFTPAVSVPAVDILLADLIARRVIEKRLNKEGSETWGPSNKLARHVASGIPIDFFASTTAHWYCDLVCRTGGSQNNIRISTAAQKKGWQYKPYSPGFRNLASGEWIPIRSEREAFELVGLKYLEPWERE